jgi:Tfp pilus assembly protein PilF
MASGRPAEARPALERALSMDPDGGQAALALGFCELELGGLGRARRLFSAAAAGPWRARALFGLAQASLREKRREEAVDLLRSSLALDPWQADAAESLAAALAGAGRAAEARAVLDEVLARLAARRGALPTGSPAAARLGAMESRLRRNRPK